MAAQKCKNIQLQAALKDFWSSANPKLKKSSYEVYENSYFFRAIPKKKKQEQGVPESYFCFQVN